MLEGVFTDALLLSPVTRNLFVTTTPVPLLLRVLSFLLSGLMPTLVLAGGQVDVRVKGDHENLEKNANVYVGDVTGRTEEGLHRYASHATDQVTEALRALGYYSPTINWRIEKTGKDDTPRLIMDTEPGKPVLIQKSTIKIEGAAASDPDFGTIQASSIKKGQILNHGNYGSVRQRIATRARKLGYFDGKFLDHKLVVDPATHSAEISLVYQSGSRYHFGQISFSGKSGFERQLLDGFLEFSPGDLYSADKIAELDSNLSNSGYFSSVVTDAPPEKATDSRVPINVRLKKRDPRSVAAGVGFSTNVGPRVRGTWTERWINNKGHRRGADLELSAPRQLLTGYYEIPLDPPMTDALRFNAGYEREDIEDVNSQRLSFGPQYRHRTENDWLQILSLRYQEEYFEVGEQEGKSQLLLPGISYSKLQVDDPIDPDNGYRLQIDVTGAHHSVLSDVDLVHVLGIAKGLTTLGTNHRFLARLQLGAVATNSFRDVPPSLRFFVGGDQSVRGYGYRTLAPEDDEGNILGGRYLIAGSIEYQYSLTEKWRLATFVDEGNAVDDISDPLVTSVGIGVRWVSPVGPLRLDLARGLDEDSGGGWRIHFAMGPEL